MCAAFITINDLPWRACSGIDNDRRMCRQENFQDNSGRRRPRTL